MNGKSTDSSEKMWTFQSSKGAPHKANNFLIYKQRPNYNP